MTEHAGCILQKANLYEVARYDDLKLNSLQFLIIPYFAVLMLNAGAKQFGS
jgi:hypothetical protein